ncbi:MAG: ribokinase [Chloroflexi bacterium]|nr:ribokinase [Chloroflexota bacterium]
MAIEESEPQLDYLLVGHVARDLIDGQPRVGGTVLYAGLTAARLGRHVAVVTACARPFPEELGGLNVSVAGSTTTTTIDLRSSDLGRTMRLISRAAPIGLAAIPDGWRSIPLVHLAPIVDEIDTDLGQSFPDSLVVATPQGWLRECVEGSAIRSVPERLPGLRGAASIMVLSVEDLGGEREWAEALAPHLEVLAVTEGSSGYWLYSGESCEHFPSFPAQEVDATGAGDVFAAAYFVRFGETSDPLESGRFAAGVAAMSVEGVGTSRIPTRAQAETRLEAWGAA